MMTVKEMIKTLKGQTVKIGAGSAYFFMGKINDEAEMVKFFETVDKKNLKNAKDRISLGKRRCKKLEEELREYLSKKGEKKNERKYEVTLRNLCDKYVAASDNLMKNEMYVKIYKPIIDRDVKEIYNSLPVMNEKISFDSIIVIDGSEAGEYWLWQEWEEAHNA